MTRPKKVPDILTQTILDNAVRAVAALLEATRPHTVRRGKRPGPGGGPLADWDGCSPLHKRAGYLQASLDALLEEINLATTPPDRRTPAEVAQSLALWSAAGGGEVRE